MTKAEKQQLVSELTTEFKEASAIVVCDYKGMTCYQIEALRADARENDAKVRVVKNTLALIALKEAGQESLEIKDTNIVIWGNDQLTTCKVADRATTANKDKFVVKSGILEGSVVDAKTVIAMAKLPGREELLGMLLNVWNGPARSFAIGLQALAAKRAEVA
ncbi:MAG: 50S ribosomal protein L10 [Sulfurovaceae bacterium]|nr:50S ribosomal protein L10 [Sulfurovaceae bacterium]MDD5549243.1 50S ribosomal protein L10 [Sulfurovaceae bacterium]